MSDNINDKTNVMPHISTAADAVDGKTKMINLNTKPEAEPELTEAEEIAMMNSEKPEEYEDIYSSAEQDEASTVSSAAEGVVGIEEVFSHIDPITNPEFYEDTNEDFYYSDMADIDDSKSSSFKKNLLLIIIAVLAIAAAAAGYFYFR